MLLDINKINDIEYLRKHSELRGRQDHAPLDPPTESNTYRNHL
jgi:hypothetical protein